MFIYDGNDVIHLMNVYYWFFALETNIKLVLKEILIENSNRNQEWFPVFSLLSDDKNMEFTLPIVMVDEVVRPG